MRGFYHCRPAFHPHGVQKPPQVHQRAPRNRRIIANPMARTTHGVEHPLRNLDATMSRRALECAQTNDQPRPTPSSMHDDGKTMPRMPRIQDRQDLVIAGSLSTASSMGSVRTRVWGTSWSRLGRLKAAVQVKSSRPNVSADYSAATSARREPLSLGDRPKSSAAPGPPVCLHPTGHRRKFIGPVWRPSPYWSIDVGDPPQRSFRIARRYGARRRTGQSTWAIRLSGVSV
jgi:hypothetical protein